MPFLMEEAQCHNTICHHYIPHTVVDTIPHIADGLSALTMFQ